MDNLPEEDKNAVQELQELLTTAQALYDEKETEASDKVKLLVVIGDLKNKIREEKYKQRIINGGV